jgi:hypothetical protein
VEWSEPFGNVTVAENLVAGNYSVEVTDSNGCQEFLEFVIDLMTNTIEYQPYSFLMVYPNPTSGKIFLTGLGIIDIKEITIFDVEGKQLTDWCIEPGGSEVRIDLGLLSPGLYQIIAISGDGKVYTSRFVSE